MTAETSGTRREPAERPPAAGLPTVGVVIPVGPHAPALSRALAAVRQATPPPDAVVIVCDGCASETVQAAREAGCDVVELAQPGGPAVARNAGARALGTDILLFVDADVAMHADLVAAVRAAMADPEVTAVVGCYDATPPAPNFFSQYKNLLQRFVHLQAREAGSTFWGACGAVRRRAFFAVGGFDERFRLPSVEDIDLGYRMKAAGFTIRFDPALEITHLKRWTMASLVRSDVLRRALPWTWLLLRERRIERDLNLRYASRAAGVLAWGLAVSLAMSVVDARALGVAALAGAALFVLDRRLWRFFRRARGAGFATRALLWHWVYYLYGTVGFVAGVLMYPVVGRRLVHPGRLPVAPHGTNGRDAG